MDRKVLAAAQVRRRDACEVRKRIRQSVKKLPADFVRRCWCCILCSIRYSASFRNVCVIGIYSRRSNFRCNSHKRHIRCHHHQHHHRGRDFVGETTFTFNAEDHEPPSMSWWWSTRSRECCQTTEGTAAEFMFVIYKTQSDWQVCGGGTRVFSLPPFRDPIEHGFVIYGSSAGKQGELQERTRCGWIFSERIFPGNANLSPTELKFVLTLFFKLCPSWLLLNYPFSWLIILIRKYLIQLSVIRWVH